MREKTSWILYVSTFPPRECGIATFTKDVVTSTDKAFLQYAKSKVVAMNNDVTNIYNYPDEVIAEINDSDLQDYIDAAKKINDNDNIKIINIQHEFGIFGGEYGSYLIAFMEIINKPMVITFHSVQPSPNDKLKKVVQSLAEKCVCIVVMANTAIDILRNDYNITKPIEFIPHGIPTVEYVQSHKEKAKLNYGKRIILSSFGMMSPGKGYEYVLEAIPKILEKFPSILYIIVGETHPAIRQKEGEQYRNMLQNKIKELKIQKHVKFYNKYVKLSEIIKYLEATDVYISSSTEPNQITSGTLVYAMGAGRAVVSTPFLHAKEIVTPERGVLADFKNPDSISEGILKILSDDDLKEKMEKNAYAFTRQMVWPNVVKSYMDVFRRYAIFEEKEGLTLPHLNLNHLNKMTDNFGIIQFANLKEPDISSGYTLDDNARAMLVECMQYKKSKDESLISSIKKYLEFIKYVAHEDGRLFNYVDKDKKINYDDWSQDAHGRAIWCLGYLLSIDSLPKEIVDDAETIFHKAIKHIDLKKSPRSIAFTILGLYYLNSAKPSEQIREKIIALADHLVSLQKDNLSNEWKWFESYLTYSNSKLSESLFYAYPATGNEIYLQAAKSSLDFLISINFEKNRFAPIGQKGWYIKEGHRAYFDQQPVDTASMVQTLQVAYSVTKDEKYRKLAIIAFQWFLGKNSLNQALYDHSSGGCHDGIGQFSVNLNQGAESTIAYLIARLALDKNVMSDFVPK